MNDPIVQEVVDKLIKRSEVGISKYGTTLKANNEDDFLTHLQEECMDAANYLQKLKSILKNKGYEKLEDVPDFYPTKGLYPPEVYIKAVKLANFSIAEAKFVCTLLDEAQFLLSQTSVYVPKSPKDVMIDICSILNVSLSDLSSKKRTSNLTYVRAITSIIIFEIYNNTFQEIGELFNRDRNTIYYYLKIGLDCKAKLDMYNKVKRTLNIE